MSWSQVAQISWCKNCAHLCDCNLVSCLQNSFNDFRTPWATLCRLARRYLSHNAYDSHDGHILSKIVCEERHILLIEHLKAWSPNANTKSLLATLTSPQEDIIKILSAAPTLLERVAPVQELHLACQWHNTTAIEFPPSTPFHVHRPRHISQITVFPLQDRFIQHWQPGPGTEASWSRGILFITFPILQTWQHG